MKKEIAPKTELLIGITLQGIKTEQFAILDNVFKPKKEIGVVTSMKFKIDDEKKQIGVYAQFEFQQIKKTFIIIEVSCHFLIEEKAWKSFIYKKEKKITIPKTLMAHLGMITVGTSRGVLHAKLVGATIPQFLVPIVNVTEMIPEDMQFEMVESE